MENHHWVNRRKHGGFSMARSTRMERSGGQVYQSISALISFVPESISIERLPAQGTFCFKNIGFWMLAVGENSSLTHWWTWPHDTTCMNMHEHADDSVDIEPSNLEHGNGVPTSPIQQLQLWRHCHGHHGRPNEFPVPVLLRYGTASTCTSSTSRCEDEAPSESAAPGLAFEKVMLDDVWSSDIMNPLIQQVRYCSLSFALFELRGVRRLIDWLGINGDPPGWVVPPWKQPCSGELEPRCKSGVPAFIFALPSGRLTWQWENQHDQRRNHWTTARDTASNGMRLFSWFAQQHPDRVMV